MKAIVYKDFGGSDVISYEEVQNPVLKNENDVLIEVKAASVNPLDLKIRQGFMQKMRPVSLPYIPGLDVAGIVKSVGKEVQGIQVGDEVIAITMGNAYAEFVIANATFIAPKPKNISFEEASSLAVNIGTAQTILFNEGQLKSGDRILIQGAAGAVGATMVQMAKLQGLYVYATASGKGVAFVKNLGADEVFDYKASGFSLDMRELDLVADCAGGEAQQNLFQVLKAGGKLLSIAGMPSAELANQFKVDARFISSNLTAQNLISGFENVAEGKIKPFVSQVFPLNEAAQAQDLVAAGGINGKVVLKVNDTVISSLTS